MARARELDIIPTRLTTRTATQMATPSDHSFCSRADGTADPIIVDTCDKTGLG
jgi:hypothetical protein